MYQFTFYWGGGKTVCMAYTIIFLSQTNTHQSTRSVQINPWVLRLLVLLFVILPFATFMLGARTFSSQKLTERLEAAKTAYIQLEAEASNLRNAYEAMMEEQSEITSQMEAERKQRAEAEARAAITDNARANTSTHLQQTEQEIFDLTRRLKMYESLVGPSEEQLRIQCYNIDVAKTKQGIRYDVQFLKTDVKDEANVDMQVKLRMLAGTSIVALKEVPLGNEGNIETSMTKHRQLRGQLNAQMPDKGLRIIDISAYDGDTLVSSCWKVF